MSNKAGLTRTTEVVSHAITAQCNPAKTVGFAQRVHELGSGSIRQSQIGNNEIEPLQLSRAERLGYRGRGHDCMTVPTEQTGERLKGGGVVFHDEQTKGHRLLFGRGIGRCTIAGRYDLSLIHI